MSDRQVEALRLQIERMLNEPQRAAAEKEIEAQAALLASAHTFHVQQQRFHDRLQAELAALHQKERLQETHEHALQTRLRELNAKVNEAATPATPAGAGAPRDRRYSRTHSRCSTRREMLPTGS